MLFSLRLLTTLILALSLPVHGIAGAWQACCESGTSAASQAQQPVETGREYASHHHEEPTANPTKAAHTAEAGHRNAHPKACSHSASCCTLALLSACSAQISAMKPQSAWVALQPTAPASHTPTIADPPPRASRS
jgi:hypothetical protein